MQWPIVDAIMKLTGLQELTLAHWNLRSEDMYMIFLGCSATLQRLTLRTISGYDEEVFVGFKRHIWITSPAEPIMSPSPETPPPLLGLHQPLPLQLTALRELQLTLDWPQSRAVVHLPRICPALEILVLEVDIEEFDLPVMITNLRQYCPRLHSIQYIEGYSMRHETGYYPDPDIYASLFRDSARHLKTAIIPLHDRLDRQKRIVGALETHVNTLETIKLSLTWSHSLNIALITSIVIKAPKLKRLVLRVGCEVQDMDPLLSKPWMCLNLESLVISEYSSENISDNMVSPLPPTFAALALNNQQHLLYKDEGQGWFLKQGKNAKYYAVAVRDYEFKVRLFRHMRTSGLVHVRRVTMDGTQFYAEEQPLSDFEENDDDDE
ncbi:hypothetical protein BGX28_003023 [Mortierella sp. GBA30]|nr:hypothetical protein BGX28_003023 [Mortierella sp. GBA30]